MEIFDETEHTEIHKKKIQWPHIFMCIISLSLFFIILSIILNKDEQIFLYKKTNIYKISTLFSSIKKENSENIDSQPEVTEQQVPEQQIAKVPEQQVPEQPIPETPVEQSQKNTGLTSEQYEKIIHIYTPNSNKTVYLTFDDGPSQNVTPLILDELKKENIKATFFMLGSNATYYPEIVKQVYENGHYIANHGYSHVYSEIYETADSVLNDYQACEQALRKALNNENFQSKVYRFPGGSSGGYYDGIKQDAKAKLKDNNIAYLDWNALTFDAEAAHTKELILENLSNTVGDKNVVVLLMHDSSSKILTYETLPDVINFFKERGYTFNTLYDIIQ